MDIELIEHTYESNFHLRIENLEIKENTIVGLIGANGAGKTTLMSILSGYMKPNTLITNNNSDFKKILFIPSDIEAYDFLTVSEFIRLVIKYSDLELSENKILEKLDLVEKKKEFICDLSQGMRKKITLIQLLNDKYDFIILDEPFNSIDVSYIYKLKLLITELKKTTTILISSHILETLADICDEFIILKNGRVKELISNNNNIKILEEKIFEENNTV